MEYLALVRSLSVGHVHGLGVMFLGSLYRWLNVVVNDVPLSKLNGALWNLQVWLFSYFPELVFPPGSPTKQLSWKNLISFTQGVRRVLDLSAARNSKKGKEPQVVSAKLHTSDRGEKKSTVEPSRKRTRSATKPLSGTSKYAQKTSAGSITVEDDGSSSTIRSSLSVDPETESDDYLHSVIPLSPRKRLKFVIESHTVDESPLLVTSDLQDLTERQAMVSSVDEDLDFDFSFLDSGPSPTISSSNIPSGLEVATAKASLRHFLNMSLDALGAMEKNTILFAMSILQSSLDFSPFPLHDVLTALPTIFSAFQDSSSTCSETLVPVRNFKDQKAKLDGMLSKRQVTLSTLHQKNAEFDAKEELVKKLEAELVQHKADMVTLLHDNEVLKNSFDRLKADIQSLGEDLVNQKHAYQQWEDTLRTAERTRTECLSKWEELRQLDLS
ncbi:uncharacterized protein [Primulina eburnea]|uniref:uncharacterized protein n=1 Tax=Primulina eburnea TaxID=1245227 RepID=UPI003C6CAA87